MMCELRSLAIVYCTNVRMQFSLLFEFLINDASSTFCFF